MRLLIEKKIKDELGSHDKCFELNVDMYNEKKKY